MLICSSSPSPRPVMLSPRCTTEPSRVSRWLKKARSNSCFPAYWMADASRSTSGEPVPRNPAPGCLSQPSPIVSLLSGVSSSWARRISWPRVSSITPANLLRVRDERPHGLDGVRLVRGLVVAVAHDPGEAERQATGVAGRALEAVEGDLHDLLRAQRYDVGVADRAGLGRQLGKALGLPGQQRVGHALERLPEHRERAVGVP